MKTENDADFAQFWSVYPRKVARAHALKMWRRLNDSEKFAALHAIGVHARYWAALGTRPEKIPHAGTWLNPEEGRRWEDELEMPEPAADNDWMRSETGIMREGLRRGIRPRPGESMQDFKARVAMQRVA